MLYMTIQDAKHGSPLKSFFTASMFTVNNLSKPLDILKISNCQTP